jgi:tRNA pseudouridine13 synthase
VGEWAEEALAARGLTWEQLRVKGMNDVFFSKGHRVAVVVPRGVESSVERDPLYPGRQALRLAFVLPRGSYATVFVKALSQRGKDHGTPAGD